MAKESIVAIPDILDLDLIDWLELPDQNESFSEFILW